MELTKEQKKRVESVFHEALNLPLERRDAFLAKTCSDDEPVYQEAASLLRHYESAGDLKELGAPRKDFAVDLPLPEHIGPYEVIDRLGHGGMGEVYLARDPRLGRKVAVKVLSAAIAETPGAMERLRREALAASALNHPNILTVHEFGEAGGTQYIVTEYVEGTSLRELIGELSPEQAIDYARQIGEALAAAHRAGIIHRDVKPENVMVRPDGYVKVLDFGLAKASPLPGTGTTSIQQRLERGGATVPGMLIGTINYMSPEQIRGQEVDQRTDIWSWGVVLFEMLAGRRPFPATAVETDLGRTELLGRNVRLIRLLDRALAAAISERYPKMDEALADLQKVRPIREARSWPRALERFLGAGSHQIVSVLGFATAVAVAVVLALWLSRSNRQDQPVTITSQIRLTNRGDVLKAAISPDGEYIAYAVGDGKKEALRLRQVKTNADIEKVPAVSGRITGITFGNGFIYYVIHEKSLGTLYRAPLLGGEARAIASDVDSQISFAPDSGRFVFLRMAGSTTSLVTQETGTGRQSVLAKLEPPTHFFAAPLWSSDGKYVISEIWNDTSQQMKFMSARVSDGRQSTIGAGVWTFLRKPAWIADQSLIVAASDPRMSRSRLVQVFLPSGASREVMGGLTDYTDVSAAPRQQTLVAVQQERYASIWILPQDGKGEARKLTQASLPFHTLTWAKAGKLISQSETAGRPDLVAVDISNGEAQSLTDDEFVKIFPEASPDGRYVIYASNRDGTFHLWRADANGMNAVRLTSDKSGEEEGVVTPDGRWVIFTSLQRGFRSLWRVSIEGGEPTPITAVPSAKPSISPDGTLLACEYLDEAANVTRIAILNADTGKLVRFLPNIATGLTRVRWARDGKRLLYAATEHGIGNLWAQPVNGGNPAQITHFDEDEIFSLATSPDGSAVACLRGRNVSDAVLVRLRSN